MDFIPNHTSNKHPWFYESENNNDTSDYYIWIDNNSDTIAPNNWRSVFGGSAWTYSKSRKAWYFHQFLAEQPDLNMRSESVQNEIKVYLSFFCFYI